MFHNLFSGLRARLMLLVFLAVVPALGWILYTSAEQRHTSANEVRAEADFVAQITAKDQENNIAETRKLLLTLARLSEVRNDDSAACSSLFAKLLEQFPQYANLGVVKPSGAVICSGVPLQKPVSFADRGYFHSALNEHIFAASNFEVDEVTGLPTITFAYPVIDSTGEVRSVVFAAFNLIWLNQQSIGAQLPEGASMIMVDRNNKILGQFPNSEDWIGKTVPAASALNAAFVQPEKKEIIPGLDGVLRLYAFTSLRAVTDTGYVIGVGISEAAALKQSKQALLRDLALLGIVFLLALAAAWIGGDLFILRRVRSLLNATQRVSEGDLQVRTGLPYGNGELSQLARSFDNMTAALQQREEERRQAEQEIIRHNRDLAALNTVTATVSSSLKLPEILESLKNLLIETLEVPGGAIFFYDEDTDMLHAETAWGVPAAIFYELKRFPADTLHYKHVVRDNQTIFNRDLRQVIPFSILGLDTARPDWHSYICVPLLSKGKVQGVLDLFSRSTVEFTQENVQLFTALGQQVGIAIQNARLFEQVERASRSLQHLSQQLLEVQESERRHLSRELHDEIGQSLTAVKVNLQAIERTNDLSELSPQLNESIGIIERALQQVRDLSLDLRPSLLDDLGVVAALRWYTDRQAQRAGFEASFAANIHEIRLPAEIETTCFRVVQEALTNIVRHAHAKHVQIELAQLETQLELRICDDGIGFDVKSALERGTGDFSLGLLGMQERAQLIGGKILIFSDPQRGTEIQASFPLSKSKTSHETITVDTENLRSN